MFPVFHNGKQSLMSFIYSKPKPLLPKPMLYSELWERARRRVEQQNSWWNNATLSALLRCLALAFIMGYKLCHTHCGMEMFNLRRRSWRKALKDFRSPEICSFISDTKCGQQAIKMSLCLQYQYDLSILLKLMCINSL